MQDITSCKQIEEQSVYNFNKLTSFLSSLPLSYMNNMKLHSIINKHPAESFLTGIIYDCAEFQNRIRPWIEKAFLESPHLNN